MDEVEDFGIKEMKTFPGDWRLPQNMSGFASCQIKRNNKIKYTLFYLQFNIIYIAGVIAICGGNTG